jgi:hypothetical protein
MKAKNSDYIIPHEIIVIKLPLEKNVKWIIPNRDKNSKVKLIKKTDKFLYYKIAKFRKVIMIEGNTKVIYPAYTFQTFEV